MKHKSTRVKCLLDWLAEVKQNKYLREIKQALSGKYTKIIIIGIFFASCQEINPDYEKRLQDLAVDSIRQAYVISHNDSIYWNCIEGATITCGNNNGISHPTHK